VTILIDEARHPDHRRRLEKSVSSHSAHNTITLALTGAPAALAFSAATAHADPAPWLAGLL
jgi:hypothetical protein